LLSVAAMIFSGLQPWASGGHAWRQAQPAQAAAASKAKQPRPTPVVFRPSSYPGALLTPSGEIDLNAAVGRRHLVEEFGLKPRDIAAMFSKNARRGFGLNVRRGGALLSLGRDGPSVVVANTTAWILLRDSRDKSLADVGAKIQQKFVDLAASVREQHTAEEPGHTAEEPRHIAEEPGREPVPFALAVTEALLTIYLDKISGELEEAVEKADLLIRDYTAMRQDQAGTPQLEKLRITKQRLDAVQSQAKSFQTVLLQALEDEDDLSDLAKSVGPTKEEWELCFEYYSQSAAEVDAEVSAHVEAMDDLENFWLLRLSARRLELEKSAVAGGLGRRAECGCRDYRHLRDEHHQWPGDSAADFLCPCLHGDRGFLLRGFDRPQDVGVAKAA